MRTCIAGTLTTRGGRFGEKRGLVGAWCYNGLVTGVTRTLTTTGGRFGKKRGWLVPDVITDC